MQSGSGVHDTVVNQLLTKIDGVDALNNILLIGMTNRRGPACEKIVMHACTILFCHLAWHPTYQRQKGR